MSWKKGILALIIVIVLVGVGIFAYQNLNIPSAILVSKVSGKQPGESLLSLLGSLEGLRFDISFFEKQLYKSLQDFTIDISLPSVKGRLNPFAPLD